MKWGWTLVMLAVYYGLLGLILNGMAGAVNEYNTLDNSTVPVDYNPDDVFTGEMEEWYEAMSEDFELAEQKTWPGDNKEMGLSDRIDMGPVFHDTVDHEEYPDGDWIHEPDTWHSVLNQLTTGKHWRMKYDYYDYEHHSNLSAGQEVYIYPHVYYNSPGKYFSGSATETPFITVWGFDATRGKVFQEVYSIKAAGGILELKSGYSYSYIYKFYGGQMSTHDLQYVIDVAILKEQGLVDEFITSLKGGMSYKQIENQFDVEVELAERYCGVIYGKQGRAEYWHNVPQGQNIPHIDQSDATGAFKWLKDAITGFAFLTSDEVPAPIGWLARILVFGPLGILISYIVWTEVRSLIPFISGGG